MRHRLAVVATHPIQYLAPWYRHLGQQPELDVTVFYGSGHGLFAGGYEPEFGRSVRWDVDLTSGYRWQLLTPHSPRPDVTTFFGNLSLDVFGVLSRSRFDAVLIQGWNCALYPLALAAARAAGLPVLLRGDSVRLPDAVEPPPPATIARRLKRGLLGRYLGACAALLALSSGNRRRLADLGVPDEKVSWSPLAVEGSRFALPAPARAIERRATRQRLGLPREDETPLILFCAKLVPKKEPGLLLDAYAALRRQGARARLVLAGEGALRGELEAAIAAQRIPDVSFLGFVNQAELPALYAASDLLVLPSSHDETFGLVVAEAMHAGLPVIASDHVGCAEDLVQPQTGLVFRNRDGADLLRCLRLLCADPDAAARRLRLGQGAQARMSTWTYAESTAGLLEALRRAVV